LAGPSCRRRPTRLSDQSPYLIDADTVELEDTGIPFAYVDADVKNGFQYFYKVTAFDVNSAKSGPSSLESAGPAKSTMPRGGPAVTLASFTASLVGGTQELNPAAAPPAINSQTGIFAGPMPPTNALEATFVPLVERLLPAFKLSMTIDSVLPFGDTGTNCPNGSNWLATCWWTYVTWEKDGVKTPSVVKGFTPTWISGEGVDVSHFGLGSASVKPDPEAAAQFGIPTERVSFDATVVGTFIESIRYSSHENQSNRRSGSGGVPSRLTAGGSRWFAGANESTPDPTRWIRVGHIDGVDSIFAPISHTPIDAAGTTLPTTAQCFPYALAFLGRAADVQFRWKGTAAPEVFDVTHNVAVPFKPGVQASYGFLTDDADGDGMIDRQTSTTSSARRRPSTRAAFAPA
jgi:hypothetical protein